MMHKYILPKGSKNPITNVCNFKFKKKEEEKSPGTHQLCMDIQRSSLNTPDVTQIQIPGIYHVIRSCSS